MTDNKLIYKVYYAPLGSCINEANLIGKYPTREDAENAIQKKVDHLNEIDEYTFYRFSDYVIETGWGKVS